MKILRNKRADQTFNVITFMFFRIGFLIVVLFFMVFLVKGYITTSLDVSNLEAQIFMHSILNNKNGIIFNNENTGRSFPEIIDLSKFNNENIASALENTIDYGKDKRHIAAKLELKDIENKKLENTEQIIYNEEWYNRLHTLAVTKIRGPGGAKEIIRQFFVLIKDEDDIKKGILEISVVIPNS